MIYKMSGESEVRGQDVQEAWGAANSPIKGLAVIPQG